MSVDLERLASLAAKLEEMSRRPNHRNSGGSWFRVQNAVRKPETTEVFIYDYIGDYGVSAKDFVAELRNVKTSRIDLHINSGGGAVFDGVAIYNALVNHPANILTIVDGLAASAASFIAMAGTEIEVEKTARLMIHDAHGLAIGNAAVMRAEADLLDDLSDMIAGIYAERAGGDVKTWRAAMLAETWYSAEKAVEVKLANRVAGDILSDRSSRIEIAKDPTPPPSEVAEDNAGTISPEWLREALKGASALCQ